MINLKYFQVQLNSPLTHHNRETLELLSISISNNFLHQNIIAAAVMLSPIKLDRYEMHLTLIEIENSFNT
jgi:hypothetical protein